MMQRIIVPVFAAAVGALAAPQAPAAAPRQQDWALRSDVEVSAQSRPRKRRPPQIRVTPRYPRATTFSLYPRPYDFHAPGPGARRECVARLVQEARPSGTVVVPRMWCWWTR